MEGIDGLMTEIKSEIENFCIESELDVRYRIYKDLKEHACFLAEKHPDAEWLRAIFTTICLYFYYSADTSETDEMLLEIWNNLKKSDFALSFYSKYADDDRDDEYEEESDPLMARYENGFENYMLEYLI